MSSSQFRSVNEELKLLHSSHGANMDIGRSLHLLVIIGYSSVLISGATNYVKPRGLSELECPDEPCLILDAYVRESVKYFVSNTTFIFLPGTHVMKFNLRLENLTNMALYGSLISVNTSTIIFNPLANITWVDSENISIAHLVFILSGTADSEAFFSTVVFYRCADVYLLAVDFVGGDSSRYSTALRCHTSDMAITNCTFSNCSSFIGAGVTAYSCAIFAENNTFVSNRAQWSGGGTLLSYCVVSITGQNTYFNNTVGGEGGAISSDHSIVDIKGVTLFVSNTATYFFGGAVSSLHNIQLRITDSTQFFNNFSGWEGGALVVLNSTAELSGSVSFDNNTASIGGGGIATYKSSLVGVNVRLTNNTVIHAGAGGAITCNNYSRLQLYGVYVEGNTAISGGAVGVSLGSSASLENTTMTHNRARGTGGAISVQLQSSLTLMGKNYFIGNTVELVSGGAINIVTSSASLNRTNYFSDNSAALGGALVFLFSDITVNGSTILWNNSARRGGGVLVLSSTVTFHPSAETYFIDNKADQGGGLLSVDASLAMAGTQNFFWNTAIQGGAIALLGSSKLSLVSPLNANFRNNRVERNGGGVFFDDPISTTQCNKSFIDKAFNFGHCPNPTSLVKFKPCDKSKECFFELESHVPFNASLSNITLTFVNNSATHTGSVLYGGLLDDCRVYLGGGIEDDCGNRVGGEYSDDPITVFKSISDIDNELFSVSSDPFRVCFCTNGIPNCTLNMSVQTVTGREFIFSAIAVGQGNFIVPSSIRVDLDTNVRLDPVQNIQQTGQTCTDIRYRLHSAEDSVSLVLYPDGPCRDIGIARREVKVTLLPCPEGFMKSGSECVCEERLQAYTTDCSIDDSSIGRSHNNFWVEALYSNQSYEGLILHRLGCPFDYCVDTPVRVNLDNHDVQCNHNHLGTLCGSCKENFSVVLGTLHCLPCSSAYLALTLPFALAGVALVAFLLLVRLTVAQGTLSGLILYANVVQVNHQIFFPPGDTNILTVFIAWLNLDLGIETCFYDGMNVYAYTWLQYLFPFYVWFLIGLIIVLCRYSITVSRSLGSNPVAVLSTLILLSYAKILRTIITSLSYTVLEYPNSTLHHVWLYNGDVPYFQSGEHIALGVFAILALVFLFHPYTVLMLFSHKLIAYSDKWFLSWLNRIMPFIDTYHAPFKREHRYWTGFLLLLRCALFLTFALNTLGSASVNLITISSVSAGLMVIAWIRGKLYLKLYNDILEASFILNLCIFSAATYHVNETGGSQAGLAYTSVGIAFATFIGILFFHIYLQLKNTTVWRKLSTKINFCQQPREKKVASTKACELKVVRNQCLPTTSVIELDQVVEYTA